jgi:ketosteroid isomerase-like protein
MEHTMRVFLITATAIVVLFFGSHQLVWAADTDSQVESVAEVIAASKSIISAFGSDDPETYFQLFDPEATFIFYNSPKRLQNRADYQSEWASWRRDLGFRVLSCTSSDQRVQLLGDVAILTHIVRTEIATNQGQETLSERETIVFHRRDGRWVAVHEHLSPRPDVAE